MVLLSTASISSAEIASSKPSEINSPSRSLNRWGVGVSGGGPGLLYSLNGDYYITPNIDIELGGSFIPLYSSSGSNNWNFFGAYFGAKYAFLGHQPGQRWSPYLGVMATVWILGGDVAFATGNSIFSSQVSTEKAYAPFFGAYFPLGIELIAFNGFTFAFELAYLYIPSSSVTLNSKTVPGATSTMSISNVSSPYAAIRFGFHF